MKQVWSILLLLGLAQMSFGQLEGPLSGTLGPSEFHVIDTISVEATDTLTLMPGTTFNFDGAYPFHIYGTLLAEGTESDSIIFTTDTLANPDRWRGLRFYDSTSSGSQLAYCLVEKGRASGDLFDGGGVYCSNSSSPRFVNCTISVNEAVRGGGVSSLDSSPSFANCVVRDNTTYGYAGGVYCGGWDARATFTNCTISGNTARSGGGILCINSSPVLTSCTISGNSADDYGGGVFCLYESSPVFTNCIISDNSAASGGGAYVIDHSPAEFTDCTISDNTSSWGAGGIYCRGLFPSFANCTISGNTSGSGAGGVSCLSCSASFTNCSISNNSGGLAGGVFCEEWSSPTFTRCTLNGNRGVGVSCGQSWPSFASCTISGNWGTGVYCVLSSPTFNSTIIAFCAGMGVYFDSSDSSQIKFCDIFSNSGGDIAFWNDDPSNGPANIGQIVGTNANGDSCDAYYNIFMNPMFVDTAEGDYHLLASSPCIDVGDPTLPLDPDSTITDIGAFYFHQVDAEPPIASLPIMYALHPNWPNPFNPTTTIRYDVKQTGQVQLTIFNLLGQEVIRLVDSRHLAGTYTVSWNADNLPSGIYLCRMEALGFVQTRKLALVK